MKTLIALKLPKNLMKYTIPTQIGWPSELFKEEVLKGLDEGCTLTRIRHKTGLSLLNFYALLEADESFHMLVRRVEGYFQDELADRLLRINEEMEIDQAVLASRNTQWYLSRKNAARYGDRLQVQVTHVDLTQALNEAKSRIIDTTTVTSALPMPDDGSDLL